MCERQEQPGFTFKGCFAEYVVVPRADRNLVVIPEGVGFVEAAALGCRFTTAYRAVVHQGKLLEGQDVDDVDDGGGEEGEEDYTIAVFGCGGLGLSCIMIAKCFADAAADKHEDGIPIRSHPHRHRRRVTKIIAIDVSKQALDKAKTLGATHIIHASRDNNNNNDNDNNQTVRKQVWEYTNERGADLTVDAAGYPSTCENAVWCTKRGGRMVQVGLPIDHDDRPPIVPMGLVVGREIEIVGSHGFEVRDLETLLELVRDGRLDVEQLVERRVSLEEGARAIMQMDEKSPLGITMVTRFGGNGDGAAVAAAATPVSASRL